jgi:ribose transport system permease protein
MQSEKNLVKKKLLNEDLTMKIKKILSFLKNFQSYVGLVLVFLAASILCVRDGDNLFLDGRNIANIIRAVSENGIIAIGMTLVILIGGVDLSVGAVLGIVATGTADLMMNKNVGFIPVILIGMGIGAAYGLFNGVVSTKLKMQPFIVTLASMSIARGIARYWSGGIGIPLSYGNASNLAPPAFEMLGERYFGIPVPAVCFLILGIIFTILLAKTKFGRHVYAIGGNETASHLSGIKVDRVKITIFILCGVLAAIAGMIHASQLSQGAPNDGLGYELNAIAAVCIGGTSLAGGKGTIIGTIVGALILGVLDNMLGLLNVDNNLQLVVKGLIIILAVFMQAGKKKD